MNDWLGPPIDTRHYFTEERSRLLALLRGLDRGQWRAEAVPGWSVRDLAAHLLGDDYGRIATERDGYRDGSRPDPGEAFEAFIHRINAEWVSATARISPRSLVEALELTGGQVAALWARVDPDAPGLGVSWAGADPAPRWLDRARDLSEYWTHRQQIRHAVGLPTEVDPPLAGTVLDTFMRALPHTLRDTGAPEGTMVRVAVEGPAGGVWQVVRAGDRWSLGAAARQDPEAVVRLGFEDAWRLCVRGLGPEQAEAGADFEGSRELGRTVCRIVSIIR